MTVARDGNGVFPTLKDQKWLSTTSMNSTLVKPTPPHRNPPNPLLRRYLQAPRQRKRPTPQPPPAPATEIQRPDPSRRTTNVVDETAPTRLPQRKIRKTVTLPRPTAPLDARNRTLATLAPPNPIAVSVTKKKKPAPSRNQPKPSGSSSLLIAILVVLTILAP